MTYVFNPDRRIETLSINCLAKLGLHYLEQQWCCKPLSEMDNLFVLFLG